MNNSDSFRTACAYIRVSTDKQEELSPDAQRRLLFDYAKKNNLLLSDVYIENGISGKKADKRPEFLKMIGTAKSKEHPYDVILVWKYSRFARNQEESIVYKNLLKKNNVDVISISEPVVDGPFGALIERIIEWMDEYYSIRLSGEVLRGMTENALRGGYQSAAPFGYKTNRQTGIPDIVPDEAAVVQRIFDIYAYKDPSFISIARQLNDMGYKNKKGNNFEARTIRYILENPFYTGKVRWNRQHHEDHTIKDPSEWIISEGKHEPIVSEELFDLVQTRIKIYTLPYQPRGKVAEKHWLSGMVKCSCCGSTLGLSSMNVPYPYLQCIKYSKGQCQKSHSIVITKMISSIIDFLYELYNSPDPINFDELHDEQSDSRASDLEKRLDVIAKKEQRIRQAYINEIDTLEEYRENKAILVSEREAVEKELETLHHPHTITDAEMRQRILDVANVLQSDTASNAEKRSALQSIVRKITFYKETDSIVLDLVSHS